MPVPPDSTDWTEFVRSLIVDRVTILSGHTNEAAAFPAGCSRSLYLVRSGTWRLACAATGDWLRLHAGDLGLVLKDVDHQLKPDVSAAGMRSLEHEVVCIRFLAAAGQYVDGNWALVVRGLPVAEEGRAGSPESRVQSRGWECPGLPADVGAASDRPLIQLLARQLVMMILIPGRREAESRDELNDGIALAIRLIEEQPGEPWTVERLAGSVQMSRSAFAQKFKERTGTTPTQCLVDIRMRNAAGQLAARRGHLKEIARLAGYRSVSAFSAAFKRWSGHSPSDYLKQSQDPG